MGSDLRRTVVIENVSPTVDGGRYAVKREVGAVVDVTADIFKEGHDVIVAFLKYRRARDTAWREASMSFVDNDRWMGRFTLDAVDRWQFTLEAVADPFRSWLADLAKRVEAGQDLPLGLARALPESKLLRIAPRPLSLAALHHLVKSRLGRSLPRPLLAVHHPPDRAAPSHLPAGRRTGR